MSLKSILFTKFLVSVLTDNEKETISVSERVWTLSDLVTFDILTYNFCMTVPSSLYSLFLCIVLLGHL